MKWTDTALTTWGDLMELIAIENLDQVKKWGYQERTPFEWLAYLTEEVGELSEAICDEAYGREGESIVKEAVQVATLALKIAEMSVQGKEHNNG